MPKPYVKYSLLLLSRDFLVASAAMIRNMCFMITRHAFLFGLGLKDYSMNIQDLSGLYNNKIRYGRHDEIYKPSTIENKPLYGLQTNKKPCVPAISIDFLEEWNSVLRNAQRHLIEPVLTEVKVVSKAVEDKFERKLREMFPEKFTTARNKVKQQSKKLVITLRNRHHKKWLNIRRKESNFQSIGGSVREFKEQVKGNRFENVTCDRERRKKTKEKMLNVLTYRKSTPPPETGIIDLTPCEGNEKTNISSDTNYSNNDAILSEMSEIQPIIEIECYANV